MKVSPILRPFHLYHIGIKFDDRILKIVVFNEALSLPEDKSTGWSSSAFMKENYTEEKAPCLKCQKLFQNLKG